MMMKYLQQVQRVQEVHGHQERQWHHVHQLCHPYQGVREVQRGPEEEGNITLMFPFPFFLKNPTFVRGLIGFAITCATLTGSVRELTLTLAV